MRAKLSKRWRYCEPGTRELIPSQKRCLRGGVGDDDGIVQVDLGRRLVTNGSKIVQIKRLLSRLNKMNRVSTSPASRKSVKGWQTPSLNMEIIR